MYNSSVQEAAAEAGGWHVGDQPGLRAETITKQNKIQREAEVVSQWDCRGCRDPGRRVREGGRGVHPKGTMPQGGSGRRPAPRVEAACGLRFGC